MCSLFIFAAGDQRNYNKVFRSPDRPGVVMVTSRNRLPIRNNNGNVRTYNTTQHQTFRFAREPYQPTYQPTYLPTYLPPTQQVEREKNGRQDFY